jgi:TPR repeat protein
MGVAINLIEATTYYKLAVDQGHVESQLHYAVCVEKSSCLSANLTEVTHFIRHAADRGDAIGQFGSKDGVRQPSGVSIDFDEAARCFKLAADKGVSSSQVNYGGCLLNGLGVSINHTEAARYFKQAADQGDRCGQLNYGLCLTNGQGVLPDLIAAVKYFKLAAQTNNPNGQVLLGICHYLGIGCCVDLTEAADLFKVAADQGNAHGQFNYGVVLSELARSGGDLHEALRYIKMSADQKFVSGQINYGVFLFEGLGVEVDYVEAARYLKAAADQCESYGELYYGICLLDGKGVEQDAAMALEYFRRSANQGNAMGQVNVGFCYHKGLGVARNPFRSVEYFKAAADQKNAVGQFNYGLCCFHGEGIINDFIEAGDYFKLGADQGYLSALCALWYCFMKSLIGRGDLSDFEFYTNCLAGATEAKDLDWHSVQRFERPTHLKSIDRGKLMKLRDSSVIRMMDVKTIKSNVEQAQLKELNRMKHMLLKLEIDLSSLREVKVLGDGAFGVVKLMKNSEDELFAVKFFSRESLTQAALTESFMREFEALFSLRHPCIIPLYGFSRVEKVILVMKYMENGSLYDVIQRVAAGKAPAFWNPTGIGNIICGIVCGMRFIHSECFVHRDLKPSNLLIDEGGRCRIGDWGSSKFIVKGVTPWTGGVVGTFHYAAPELYGDPPYSEKIDVFAFGLILYELVVGRPVFRRDLRWEQIMKMVLNDVRPDLPPEMSEDVKTLIRRCWAGNPSDRPPFDHILGALLRIRFKVLPDVDSDSVKAFLADIRKEVKQMVIKKDPN